MKTIPYIKKSVNAGTEYRKTQSSDLATVLDQCKTVVQAADLNIPEVAALNTPNPRMARMNTGKRNSAKSICEGILDNFAHGQYDLSDKQCDALEEAFRVGSEIIEGVESIIFEEVASFPRIKITVQETDPDNTFNDLFGFDLQSVTVTKTYTRK